MLAVSLPEPVHEVVIGSEGWKLRSRRTSYERDKQRRHREDIADPECQTCSGRGLIEEKREKND